MTAPAPQNPQAEYVATETILVNGVAGYHPGDPIFAAAVDRIPGAEVGVNVFPADSNEVAALNKALAKVTGDSTVPALDQFRAAREEEGVVEPGSAGTYDPRLHTVAEVNAELSKPGVTDAEKARVIDAERVTQGRNGIVDGPHAKAAAAAPVPALLAPVRGEIAEA